MAIPRLVQAVRTGVVFPMSGNGASRRDWTYVDDTIEGALRLMGGSHSIDLMNIATGESTSLNRVIELIEVLRGVRIEVSAQPRHRFDLDETRADLTRAISTGYHPRYDVASGLLRCLNSPHFQPTMERARRPLTQKDH
jgi:UDP-glucuronate 4-epimerase